MASTQQPASSGSDGQRYATNDERKRKRMASNRESARRSRMRKQQHLEELMSQLTQLQNQNTTWHERIGDIGRNYHTLNAENNVLRAQIAELTERFDSLNSLTRFWADDNGLAVDIPEIPDTSLEPWQLPCPIQPITVNTDMLQF